MMTTGFIFVNNNDPVNGFGIFVSLFIAVLNWNAFDKYDDDDRWKKRGRKLLNHSAPPQLATQGQ